MFRPRRLRWVLIGIAVTLVVLFIAAEVIISRAAPILKNRIVNTLQTRFHGRVELAALDVSVLRGLEVSGQGLQLYPPDAVVAAGATAPLIATERFHFHSGLTGLFLEPTHVGVVHVEGLHITIPPKEARRAQAAPASADTKDSTKTMKVVVDEIICDNSRLVIDTAKPDKDPKVFELQHIVLRDVGPDAPWHYDATLTNAIPRGDIQASGTFGPWRTDDPGASTVTGRYTFARADLNTIKGIGGVLSSVGQFTGQLDRIVVDGTTETPDFSLDSARHPVPLHTEFHAIVDGTSGDTYLEPVRAKLGQSQFTTSGKVISLKGRGHEIDLDVDVPQGQIKDFLDLAVKTQPAVMTGIIATKTKLHIAPGPESVPQKLALQGTFTLRGIHFTNPQVQDKVDMLSQRARGEPENAKPGAPDVRSQMNGAFHLQAGAFRFSNLAYAMPGARVNLEGVYSLDGQEFDFHGEVLTSVSLSRMVESKWKSAALKVVSPFFRRKGGGAEIPVKISGTKSEPKFGLDVFGGRDKK